MIGSNIRRSGKLGLVRGFRAATTTFNIDYGSASGGVVLDAYAPPLHSPFTIVHVHGGGWTSATSCSVAFGALWNNDGVRSLVYSLLKYGICVFNIEVGLVPVCLDNATTTYRDNMILDVQKAVQYARAHAATYNGNPNHIVAMGESAGAQLCLMACVNGVAGDTRPDAVVSWSGQARLDLENGATLHGITSNMLGVTNAGTGAGATTAQLYSPYNQWASSIASPVRLAMYATDAIRQADGTDLRDKIVSLGGSVTYNEIAGSGHADFTGTAELPAAIAWMRAQF